MKSIRPRRFWLLWLLLTELAVVVLLVPVDWIQQTRVHEIQRVEQRLGPDAPHRAMHTAHGWFQASLIRSGAYSALHHFLIPSEAERQRSKGLEYLEDGWFAWVEERLDVLMQLIDQLYVRVALLRLWWPCLLLAGLPALWEGWVMRCMKRTNFSHVSPVIHHYSVRGVLFLTSGLGMALLAPVPLEPMFMPAVLITACVLAGLALGHLQKRI
ncbi:putative type IV conjugative transfer system coupling factor [Candidatus Glomeribacter gigasporarum BEG34]|uniref:Putative type IV conjugative transfer system coupling factor n=1 Tax=Candidatus Glomeribacter gigasporarum BEG34 TaxID=1070319 RepID=G2JBM8_9BURK|nr:DUF4400 domain-containing protein [Candidatus Glomeribacter gigasporarum]CCD30182.1 putative type IV conjugative transfer system coupling factor [Candidatus Glomeribacter gigasporarum BEG34]